MIDPETLARAEKHVRDILDLALEHRPGEAAVLVHDQQCPLACALAEAYRRCLPGATVLDFDATSPEEVLRVLRGLRPRDLAILVQTTNFRLEAFRLRVELFKREIKVIEHPHLGRMQGDEARIYLDSLAYDPNYYRRVGAGLKELIDHAAGGTVISAGACLHFASPFESAKLNVGDYRGMKNIGGQFPIGEVFTEARDLASVQGEARLFAFADIHFRVNFPEPPITLVIKQGRIVEALDSTPDFDRVLEKIRADEGEIWVREFGFGLNRAFTPKRWVSDVGTYERMCGIHLSLGAKHAVYAKPDFKRKDGRHHVDVFVISDSVRLGETEVFRDGAYVL